MSDFTNFQKLETYFFLPMQQGHDSSNEDTRRQ